jgi:hypothetical protein
LFTARRPLLRQPAKITQTTCTAAKNGKLVMSETDLMGVDAVTGEEHWYAVINQGESHDHITA